MQNKYIETISHIDRKNAKKVVTFQDICGILYVVIKKKGGVHYD